MLDRERFFSGQGSGWNFSASIIICILGALLYAHTLKAPWYLDDIPSIVENRTIQDLGEALSSVFANSRGLAEFTFALNYRIGGTDVVGYHLVNIALHLLTACVVFLVLKRVFRDARWYALAGALIFVAHPLQTQAVTYIVQRMTSMAALFFFLSLYLFIRFRETSEPGTSRWLWYAAALLSGALAVLAKQNAAVLPLALILFDRYFLQKHHPIPWRRLLAYAVPFALVPAWLGAKMLLPSMLSEGGIDNVGGMPDLVHLQNNSPLNYLITQFSVVFIYLRLLLLPYGQALDYDYPIVSEIWTWQNGVALLGVSALLVAAILLRKRSPLISFGIAWFFVGLAVESTIIPLDPVFEHRLYIPMFGFALVVLACIERLPRRGAAAAFVLVVSALSILTWQRNDLWNDPVSFHEDNLRRAPQSERVHLSLGDAYRQANRVSEAKQIYERALEINPGYAPVHVNLSMLCSAQGDHQRGIAILLEGLRRNPNYFMLYNNLAVIYSRLGNFEQAAESLKAGLIHNPNNSMGHSNLAAAYARLGLLEEAIAHYRRSIELFHTDPVAHFNLGMALRQKGELHLALQALSTAAQLDPTSSGSLYNAALIYLELGDSQAAQRLKIQLEGIDRGLAQRLQMRIHQMGSI
jgi:protein O-mannosyl-transferase